MIRQGRVFGAGALVAALLWSGAAFAQTGWVDDFKALCGGNPADFDKAIRQAPGRGYREAPEPEGSPFRRFVRDDVPDMQLLVNTEFSDGLAKANGMNSAVSRTCGVSGKGLDPAQIPALQSWVGLEPVDNAPGFPKYLFKIVDGRRVSMEGESDEAFERDLKAGGYWFLGISNNEAGVTATLTHIKAAP